MISLARSRLNTVLVTRVASRLRRQEPLPDATLSADGQRLQRYPSRADATRICSLLLGWSGGSRRLPMGILGAEAYHPHDTIITTRTTPGLTENGLCFAMPILILVSRSRYSSLHVRQESRSPIPMARQQAVTQYARNARVSACTRSDRRSSSCAAGASRPHAR
jgi:hypothetical protein